MNKYIDNKPGRPRRCPPCPVCGEDAMTQRGLPTVPLWTATFTLARTASGRMYGVRIGIRQDPSSKEGGLSKRKKPNHTETLKQPLEPPSP